jgi:hypothetical protein
MSTLSRFRPLAIACLLALAPLAQAAVSVDSGHCQINSDYDLSVDAQRIAFDNTRGSRIEMADGALWIDGEPAALSAEDVTRVRAFEAQVRRLLPEVRAIGIDAIDVAYTALNEVASALSDKPETITRRLDSSRELLEERLLGSDENSLSMDDAVVDAAVEEMVGEIVPLLLGEITRAAIAAALTGDEARVKEIEARADAMEARIERTVEARASLLEARAEALCPSLIALDEIDNALEVRLADGSPLALLKVD